MRELQNKIDALREDKSALINQLSQEHQTNAIQAFQAQTIAPVNAALQDLSARLGAIECKQPATVTIPYIPAMGNLVPVSYQYLTGEIGQSMFKIAKRFLCDDCRQKLVIEIKEIDKKD